MELPSCPEVTAVARLDTSEDMEPVMTGCDVPTDTEPFSEVVGETIKTDEETAVPTRLEVLG